MEIDNALIIIKLLADGIDPNTEEPFDKDSPYNSPSVIRALHAVLKHVESSKKKRKLSNQKKQAQNIANGKPKNAGLPWTEELKKELSTLFKKGKSIKKLARYFERTEGAIRAELIHQGLLEQEDE